MTIAGLLSLLWARRWVFLATLAMTVAAVVALALVTTPTYRVAAKFMPRHGESAGAGIQSLLGQFGGLASLAGIGAGASLDEQEAIAWLNSRAFAQRFIERHELLPILFADSWDASANAWRADLERTPTMDDAWSVFDRQIRRVTQDLRTRLVTLEIAWKDRHQAAAWANELVTQANEELRERALREADASLESLDFQLGQTNTVELRQSIYGVMEVQLNRKVLAKSRPDFAFALLDPAVVPDAERFASPRRGLMLFISFPLGLFVAAGAVVALHIVSSVFSSLTRRTTETSS